ncbi:hypothetical protein [Planctomicrobium sp. SH664]|uniref:hypothetical protein n=1 Tax=Planctomicrobium sp. SH664 TaxID=3448125 RepID=UPI003F5C5E7E
MDDRLPALLFGSALILGAVGLLVAQYRGRQRISEVVDSRERTYLQRRSSRRSQIAGMILLIGVMIMAGDSLMTNWRKAPMTFGVFWLTVILLALWVGLLAMGDLLATRSFMRRELSQLERRQLELEKLAQGLRQAQERHPVDE